MIAGVRARVNLCPAEPLILVVLSRVGKGRSREVRQKGRRNWIKLPASGPGDWLAVHRKEEPIKHPQSRGPRVGRPVAGCAGVGRGGK